MSLKALITVSELCLWTVQSCIPSW